MTDQQRIDEFVDNVLSKEDIEIEDIVYDVF